MSFEFSNCARTAIFYREEKRKKSGIGESGPNGIGSGC